MDEVDDALRKVPRRVKELSAVIIICILTVIGLICASVGISVLPKCEWGVPNCYFIVEICAYSDYKNAPATPNSLPVPPFCFGHSRSESLPIPAEQYSWV